MPVHPAASRKPLACESAFCPAVASITSSTSCGASGICLPITRLILANSCISADCVCSRPAVSMMQTSQSLSSALATARCATLAGSLPGSPRTISAPSRPAHNDNCSTAAARNVSPAPSTTRFPSLVNRWASLAIDVVFPEPFTPVTRMTVGPDAATASPADVLWRRSSNCRRIESSTTSGSTTRARSLFRTSTTIASAAPGPMSVRISTPRNSSRKGSSTRRPSRLNRSRTSVLNTCAVLAKPARKRSSKPRGAAAS